MAEGFGVEGGVMLGGGVVLVWGSIQFVDSHSSGGGRIRTIETSAKVVFYSE